jgi:hypothetical protein
MFAVNEMLIIVRLNEYHGGNAICIMYCSTSIASRTRDFGYQIGEKYGVS